MSVKMSVKVLTRFNHTTYDDSSNHFSCLGNGFQTL